MNRFASFVLCAALAANASAAPVFTPKIPITPYGQAAWTDPKAQGSGLLFEIVPGASPMLFGAYFTYTESGDDTWVVAQGPYAAASDDTRVATGELGRASATFSQGRGGSCLKCAYQAPVFEASPIGSAELTFPSATKADMRLFGVPQTRALVPLDFVVGKSLPDALAGTWTGSARFLLTDSSGTRETTDACTITFTRGAGPSPDGTYQRQFAELRRAPAALSEFLHATSPSRCGFHDGTDMWLAVDPVSGALVEYRIQGVDVVENPVAVFYLVGPNRLVARWDANRSGDTAVLGELQLDRAP